MYIHIYVCKYKHLHRNDKENRAKLLDPGSSWKQPCNFLQACYYVKTLHE